jgi:hypothetical protein
MRSRHFFDGSLASGGVLDERRGADAAPPVPKVLRIEPQTLANLVAHPAETDFRADFLQSGSGMPGQTAAVVGRLTTGCGPYAGSSAI